MENIVKFTTYTDVTYSGLTYLIGTSGLTTGSCYRITDYRTVHYMMDGEIDQYGGLYGIAIETAINTGDTESLIVQAVSYNTLAPVAYSELYPYDIIHYDWNPENWLKDISFGGNSGTEIVEGFKGVIYFRHDTLHDNHTGYDFRKVKFRRWDNGSVVGTVWKSKYQAFYSTAPGVVESSSSGAEDNFIDVLTFNCPGGEEQYNNEVQSNHIGSFADNLDYAYGIKSILSNIVFHLEADFEWFQVLTTNIGSNSGFITMNGYVEANDIGGFFCNNTIGNNFYQNTIGNDFSNNTIGNYFSNNTIGNYFSNNTIGNYSYQNTIGNDFYQNTIGNDFYYNTIGNDFYYNTIGNYFSNNTIGNGFGAGLSSPWNRHNTIGNNVNKCTIDNNLTYSVIGDDCYNLTIGNGCQYIKINNGCHNINIDNGCSSITGGTSSSGLTFANGCTNIMIGEQSRTNTFEPNCGTLILPSSSSLNHFMGSVVNVDFTQGGVLEIENTSIIHQISGNGNIYQTYINSGGTMTITTNTIGVYA